MDEIITDYKKKNSNISLPVFTSSFQGLEYQEKHFGTKQKHDTSDYNVLPKGYITYRNRSDNGYFKFNINDLGVTGIVSKFYPVFSTTNTNKQFLTSYINNNYRIKNHFRVVSVGTIQHVLSLKNLKKTNMLFPSNNEQDKIGAFLNQVNKALSLQQRKKRLLNALKKGIIQSILPVNMQLPIAEFNNSQWDLTPFKDLYHKSLNKNDGSISKNKVISLASMSWGKVPKKSDIKYMKTYFVFRKGDIAFEGNKSKKFSFGRFVENDLGTGIVSHVFNVYRPVHDNNIKFFKYYIHSEQVMRNTLRMSTIHTTMMTNLVNKDISKQKLLIPSLIIQQKIGNLLSTIDKCIKTQQQKIDSLQQIKSFFLQQMFI